MVDSRILGDIVEAMEGLWLGSSPVADQIAPAQPAAATVESISSALLIAADPNRTLLVLTNNSNVDIYLAFEPDPAVVGAGIHLTTSGATVRVTLDFQTGSALQVNARASGGSGNAVGIQTSIFTPAP
jgi:hypothetical protein